MENYYYLYKDMNGRWNTAANPVFIAKHSYCRAIPKIEVEENGFELVSDFVMEINNEPSESVRNIMKIWDIV